MNQILTESPTEHTRLGASSASQISEHAKLPENSPAANPIGQQPATPNNIAIKEHLVRDISQAISGGWSNITNDRTLDAFVALRDQDQTEYLRRLQSAAKVSKIPITVLERLINNRSLGSKVKPTHSGYATSTLEALSRDGVPPVGWKGDPYAPNENNLWRVITRGDVIKTIVRIHDGNVDCRRTSDYEAIANLTVHLVSDDAFFDGAPDGLACGSNFYKVTDKTIVVGELKADHRQRFGLNIVPNETPTPLFDAFLDETFKSDDPDECAAQISLLQEVVGAIVLGLMHWYQKAILFFDPHGRAGKGTMDRIIRELVPKELTATVSPFDWGKPERVGALAGARLNTVGELPNTGDVPASDFKSVLGGDLLSGRRLYKDPFSFKCLAAHLFMSNSLIRTKDHSDAFFARWIVIEFPNSLLKTGKPIDHTLAERIIASEMPGIASWALAGAERLLRNGKFTLVTGARAAHRSMAQAGQFGARIHPRRVRTRPPGNALRGTRQVLR